MSNLHYYIDICDLKLDFRIVTSKLYNHGRRRGRTRKGNETTIKQVRELKATLISRKL